MLRWHIVIDLLEQAVIVTMLCHFVLDEQILLFNLKQLKCVPEEADCTSKWRKWGVPTALKAHKIPINEHKNIRKNDEKKGIKSTLYDARYDFDQDEFNRRKKDKRNGFAICIAPINERSFEL